MASKQPKNRLPKNQNSLLSYFNTHVPVNNSPKEDENVTESNTSESSTEKRKTVQCDPDQSNSDEVVTKKRKFEHAFQSSWLQSYKWLKYEKGLMFCEICMKQNKTNSFTSGTNNFRTSTLTRHIHSSDHADSLREIGLKKDMVKVKFDRDFISQLERIEFPVSYLILDRATESCQLRKIDNHCRNFYDFFSKIGNNIAMREWVIDKANKLMFMGVPFDGLFQAADEAVKKSLSETDNKVVGAMRTVFWMAKEDIPLSKYPSLIKFQRVQGCESVLALSSAQNATYSSRQAGEDFISCIAEDINKKIVNSVKNAEMFSILVDESTDISISKQMVVYVRILDQNFVPHTFFLKNITIENPKSDAQVLFDCLRGCLEENGISFSHLKGFGSDGASVMVGRHNGVAAKVKELSPHCISIHCMAHRFNLATSQASKNIPFLKDFEKTLSDLYYYFGGSKSGNRKCELAEIQKILDEPEVKIKECHEIRWLAFFEAVNAVYKCWASLVAYFKRHEDTKSKTFRKALTDYKFISVMAILMDVLPSVAQVSMVLQKKNVDIGIINPALSSLKSKIKITRKGDGHYQTELLEKLNKKKDNDGKIIELCYKSHKIYIGDCLSDRSKKVSEIRETFCDALCKNINDRFPQKAVDVASAFSVLSMRPLSFLSKAEQESYGDEEMKILCNFYGEELKKGDIISKPLIDKIKCIEEWSFAKQIVIDQMYPRDSTQVLWKLLYDYHKDVLPNMLALANLALIMPYQTADCERGFSCQNGIKTSKRNRMKEENLNVLMTVKCEGEALENHDFTSAVHVWKNKKNRRLYLN